MSAFTLSPMLWNRRADTASQHMCMSSSLHPSLEHILTFGDCNFVINVACNCNCDVCIL